MDQVSGSTPQPQLALGLHRSGEHRLAQPECAGSSAAALPPTIARRPQQQSPGPRGRGSRIMRIDFRHLEEGRSLLWTPPRSSRHASQRACL